MLKAEKHFGKHQITSCQKKNSVNEAQIYNGSQQPLIRVSSPPKGHGDNSQIKTYVRKVGPIKESKELRAHRKRLLEAFTLKQPRNTGEYGLDAQQEYTYQPDRGAYNFQNSPPQKVEDIITKKGRRKKEILSPTIPNEIQEARGLSSTLEYGAKQQIQLENNITIQKDNYVYGQGESINEQQQRVRSNVRVGNTKSKKRVSIGFDANQSFNQKRDGKQYVTDNLYQAQLNGQIQSINEYQSDNNYYVPKPRKITSSAGKEITQNFFQSKSGSSGEAAKPFKVGFSFLPTIDSTSKAAKQLPPEVLNSPKHSRTPGKKQSHVQSLFHPNGNFDCIGQKSTEMGSGFASKEKLIQMGETGTRWKSKGESVYKRPSQQEGSYPTPGKTKQSIQNYGNIHNGHIKDPRDRQLEELNETLQRLAREKLEGLMARITVNTVKRKTNNEYKIINDTGIDEPFYANEHLIEGKKKKKKHRRAQKGEQHLKQYLEQNNRGSFDELLGDDLLVSQRLQGVKQRAQPQQTQQTQLQNINNQAEPGIDKKIYKLSRGAIKLNTGIEFAKTKGDLIQGQSGNQRRALVNEVQNINNRKTNESRLGRRDKIQSQISSSPQIDARKGANELIHLPGIRPNAFEESPCKLVTQTKHEPFYSSHRRRSTEVYNTDILKNEINIFENTDTPEAIDRKPIQNYLITNEQQVHSTYTKEQSESLIDNTKSESKIMESLIVGSTEIKENQKGRNKSKSNQNTRGLSNVSQYSDLPEPPSASARINPLMTPKGGARGLQQITGLISNLRTDQSLEIEQQEELQLQEEVEVEKRHIRKINSYVENVTQKQTRIRQAQLVESKETKKSTSKEGNKTPAIQDQIMSRLQNGSKASSKYSSPSKRGDRRQKDCRLQLMKTYTDISGQKIEQDSGDCSSEANESVKQITLGKPIKTKREHHSFCQEYCQYRGKQVPQQFGNLFTSNKFRKTDEGMVYSQRLFLSKECAQSEDRRMLPVLIVNLDGAVGYWDDNVKNYYVLRPNILDSLIQLSHDFRLVAISSQRQNLIFKLIHGLMNMPPIDQLSYLDSSCLHHLYFDAVYQLNSSSQDTQYIGTIKSIDEIHFDLTQILLDMQFKRQLSQNKDDKIESKKQADDGFVTFWESPLYKPHTKILIFTVERYLNINRCYSFDYNYLYQATEFIEEQSRKSPVVIQIPHLRVNTKLSFKIAHQLIFTLQRITYLMSIQQQNSTIKKGQQHIDDKKITTNDICKKLLGSNLKSNENKIKHSANIKGLGVFDANNDSFVNLGQINFSDSYKVIKQYFEKKKSNWLKVQKYYLISKPSKQEQIHQRKLNAKVTFNDQPQIFQIGDEQGLKKVTTDKTNDVQKSEDVQVHSKSAVYTTDEGKNLYNSLIGQNTEIKQEISQYAKHHKIMSQSKKAIKKENQIKEFNGNKTQIKEVNFKRPQSTSQSVSVLRQPNCFNNMKTSINHLPKEKIQEKMYLLQGSKPYALKYRALIIKSGETNEQERIPGGDLSKFEVVNLNITVNKSSFEKGNASNALQKSAVQQELVQKAQQNTIKALNTQSNKSFLIDILSKRQNRLQFTTTQEMHLQNNLSQLVGGEQSYIDQLKEIDDQPKDNNIKDNLSTSIIDQI